MRPTYFQQIALYKMGFLCYNEAPYSKTETPR